MVRLGVRVAVFALLTVAALGSAPVWANSSGQVGPWNRWERGTDAPAVGTQPFDVIGVVEQPIPGGMTTSDGVPVRGWVVDRYSAARPDRVDIYDGPLPGGPFLLAAQPYVWRQDVGNLLGSSAYKASGFEGLIPPGTLTPGQHTLTFAAHFEWIGWWTTAVTLVVPLASHDMEAPTPTGNASNAAAPAGAAFAEETVCVICGVPEPGRTAPAADPDERALDARQDAVAAKDVADAEGDRRLD